MSTKVFGGVIAFILLGLYVYLFMEALSVVGCTPQPGCLGGFNERMAAALALIGGLISALVVAELAITKPGEAPMARALDPQAPPSTSRTVKILTATYLAVWTLVGLIAFVIGLRSTELQAISDLGQAWFGLAVAAGYAYFGIRP